MRCRGIFIIGCLPGQCLIFSFGGLLVGALGLLGKLLRVLIPAALPTKGKGENTKY